ncbi:putative peptidase domain-containing protein [Chaetomidium leptoderma]|uniref:Peptidase domain-containing protein n=1 Tax=Chaetomidium leptoderma TaxID=669021 RepID=A0AAN6VMD2_9PEZI|nr:putative peptidase domain-containing protein [Chaetomidium leptoderma]
MIPNRLLSVVCLFGAGTWALPTPAEGTDTTTATATATATSTLTSLTTTATPYNFTDGAVTTFPIHASCNSTLRRQLERGLDETVQLAAHARDHILRWGHDSPFVQKYFGGMDGNGSSSTATPLGWYSRIVAGDRGNMTFRCDDPDENCATQDGWAGHWRGSNATEETVICAPSYAKRRYLDSVCGLGYTVAESALNTFWATDLLHRVLHVPRISEGVVEHFADEGYDGVVALARTDPAKSGMDSDTLQYFAIDVYAHDVAAPGVGCTTTNTGTTAGEGK